MGKNEKKRATVVDLQLRIRVNHADYELAYGTGTGDLPDYTAEQASEAVKEQLKRLGWGEVMDVKSSHWTTPADGEPGDPWMSEEARRTRVVPDVGSPGKWVAQYYDREKALWFDMGDPRDTEEEARAYLASQAGTGPGGGTQRA